MKTNKMFSRITALALILVLVLCQMPVALAADVGVGIQSMIAAQIANPGQVIADDNAKIEYQFLQGNFDGKSLSPFETNSGDFLKHGGTDAEPDNGVWAWQWRCNAGKDTVLKITAKENMYFKSEIQEGGEFHAGWAVGTTFRFVQENAAGERAEVKRITVKDTKQSVEDSTVVAHLAAGESLYIVYSGNGLMTTDFCPWFTINTETYDETQRPVFGVIGAEDSNYSDLVSATIKSQGAAIEMNLADYTFLYGNFKAGAELKSFTQFAGSGENDPGDIVHNNTTGNPNDANNGLWRWQWRACDNNETVLKITAKENVSITFDHIAVAEKMWAFHSNFTFVQMDAEGKRAEIHKIQVTENFDVAAARFTAHLAKGDTLYIVYGLNEGASGKVTSTFFPTMALNTEGYDASKRPAMEAPPVVEIPEGQENTDFSALVSESVISQGAAVEKEMAIFQFLMGDIDADVLDLVPFNSFLGDGSGTPDDVLRDDYAGDPFNALWRWQWRCGELETVLKITAKEDMVLELFTLESPPSDQLWATHAAFRFIAEDSEGLRLMVKRLNIRSVMPPEDCKVVVHMAAGDTLYVAYGIMDGSSGPATSTYFPQIKMTKDGYDASLRPAFDTVVAVNALKAETLANLQAKYEELLGDGSKYSINRQIEMEGILNESLMEVPLLSTVDEINAFFAETVALMQAVPTLEKEAEELNAYKAQKLEELKKEFTKDLYSSKNWKTVQGYLDEAEAAIAEAKSAAVVNSLVAKAKANINTVEKDGGGLQNFMNPSLQNFMNPILDYLRSLGTVMIILIAVVAVSVVAAVVVVIVLVIITAVKKKKKNGNQ